jgi:hypothetical protein
MSYISFINCIVAAAVAWIMAGLLTEETHGRVAGVLGVVYYSLKRFKAVLRAFRCSRYKYTIMTQKRKNGACRHLKRIYITVQPIQAKQKTATAAGLLSGSCYVVSETMKHSFDKYLWLMSSNPTIYCGMKNREKLRCVCHFWDFQYTDRLTGEVSIYGKNFFKKNIRKNLGCVCHF